MIQYLSITFISLLFISCTNETKVERADARNAAIGHYGRTLFNEKNELVLIGSASYVEFTFKGDSCTVFLKNHTSPGDYNYVVVEIDDQYIGRLKVEGNVSTPFSIKPTAKQSSHVLRLFKATESHNGQVLLTGVVADGLNAADHPARKKIEFIGNSITAGMANDTKDIPCGSGKWYDQHNAYWAYGPRVARALNTDFLISAVSGIGIYRNWNSNEPVMPQVFESAYLEVDSTLRRDFSQYNPDLVSICLGTNDFSDGDGKTKRLPFDSAIYINRYVAFIGTIYKHYPATQIVLLTSPMLSQEKALMMLACLEQVKKQSRVKFVGKPGIEIFEFKPMIPKGCSYHPDIADHEVLANQLAPFLEKFLGNKPL